MVGIVLALALAMPAACGAADNLLVNPSFEKGLSGWEPWQRKAGALRTEAVGRARDGKRALRVVHTGKDDWAVGQARELAVRPGDLVEIAGWVNARRLEGSVEIGVIMRDPAGEAIEWVWGGTGLERTGPGWRRLSSRFLVPRDGATIRFRITGSGPADLVADGLSLVRLTRPAVTDRPPIAIRGDAVSVRVDATTGAFAVTAAGRTWTQSAGDPAPLFVTGASVVSDSAARLELRDPVNALDLVADIECDPAAPEVTVTLTASPTAAMAGQLAYPYPFVSRPGDFLLAAYADGLLLPVSATGTGWGFESFRWKGGFDYSGWKTAMGFAGVTDLVSGYGITLATPWDSAVTVAAVDGRLAPSPAWRAQAGAFGYARRAVYRFEAAGGHVALALRHRAHAKAMGWVVPLAEKAKTRPAVASLPGSVDLWFLDRELPAGFMDDLAACGVDRAIVSVGGGWEEPGDADAWVRTAKSDGWLGSRYDIYTDVWNPADKPPEWLRTAGFPEDVIVDPDGGFHKGWVDKSPGGPFQGYNICSSAHARDARKRIAAEVARTPYGARFIDVVTANGLMECRAPAHPLTRRGDAEARAGMLRVVAEEFGLVTGSEEIREWAVPFSDWSEGTMTMKPAENAGYDWMKPVDADPDYLALNAGAAFRVPLFELVFHDSHVSSWYTGDGSTKVPACWEAKDLLNILYGTMPLWMPTKALWEEHRTRFLASYHTVNTVFRAVGGSEMTSHEFVTSDRLVQRTRFSSGHTVTANFGETDWHDDAAGRTLPRHGFTATGPGLDAWRARMEGRVVTRVETPARVFLDPGGSMWGDKLLRADGPVVLFKDSKAPRVVPLSPGTKVERPKP